VKSSSKANFKHEGLLSKNPRGYPTFHTRDPLPN
jgi:hypothetical protein